MAEKTFYLNSGAKLILFTLGPETECGTLEQWQNKFDGLFGQNPYPDLFKYFTLGAYNMDHPNLDWMTANRVPCLQDYDVNQPGNQVAAGLFKGIQNNIGILDIGFFPDNWTADYSGPARPISAASIQSGLNVTDHEFGHYVAARSRMLGSANDDISKKQTASFRSLRPHQAAADNEDEDFAESYRAINGSDECRGKFSDNKPFSPTPELRSMIRGCYALSANLAGCWIANYTPSMGGVMYQVWIGFGWKWRWLNTESFTSQEWDGSKWKSI